MLWSICWCCCLYHPFPAGACPQQHGDENLAFGYVNPQLQCGKTQSSGFLSQWPVYKLRESSMTQLKIPYNLPHNKIIAEELHKEFPVGLNPGKFFGLAHPNSNFTTERFKTGSCGWKRKRISLMQTPGKDQLTSVIVLFFLEGPCVKYEDTSFSFFLIVIVIKNIFWSFMVFNGKEGKQQTQAEVLHVHQHSSSPQNPLVLMTDSTNINLYTERCVCSIAVPVSFWSPVHRHSSILGANSFFQTFNLEQQSSTEMSRHNSNGMLWGEDFFPFYGKELNPLVKQHKMLRSPLR